ncbi:MAG: hypothetical protein EB084_24950 [Proteobacteria bacterium]|nr:hypothetical protein [Pseudomonadota bacterium]
MGLPAGCLLVNVRRAGQDVVPTGATVLRVDDRIVAAVSPQAAGALEMLREGSGAASVRLLEAEAADTAAEANHAR